MPVVQFKAIKPKRLKEKEMRLELLNGLRSVARKVDKDFQATTSTWENKPEFETIISLRGGRAEFLVGTNSEIFKFVDEGTKPHMIYPKKAKFLRFQGGYNAKTQPGVLGSGQSSYSGDTIFSRGVKHPGNKPRKFTEMITKKWKSRFKDEMHDAMRRAKEKSGHAK